jgi:ubiquinone/menaquinone biosynthesis C-methylase UbiE
MKFKHFITKLLDLGAGFYDPLIGLTLAEKEFREKLLELAHLKGNEKVLDIACGTGTFALMIAEALDRGYVFAIDISTRMVETAKKKAEQNNFKIDYKVGSSLELPYNSNEFDLVFTSLMFHHLDYGEKARTLCEIYRVLKPDGMYLSVEFGEFPTDVFHRAILGLTRSSGTLHGIYPCRLMEAAGFYIDGEMEGPALAGHHKTKYRVLRKRLI